MSISNIMDKSAFGQGKKATGIVSTGTKDNIMSKMPRESAQSFLQYYREHKYKRNVFKQLYYDFMTGLYLTPKVLNIIGRRLRIPINGKRLQRFMHRHCFKFSRSPRCASFRFPWGVSEVKERYKVEC